MADTCCSEGAESLAGAGQKRTLWIVLSINAVMFVGELIAGLLADSSALLADAADNLSDAVVYGVSLTAVYQGAAQRVRAALLMGMVQSAFGLWILGEVATKLIYGAQPIGLVMMLVAAAALAGNLACFMLLMKHRGDDLNMKAVWLCSRNDVIGNLGVIVAGLIIAATGLLWPDLVVATVVALIILHTGIGVTREAVSELRRPDPESP